MLENIRMSGEMAKINSLERPHAVVEQSLPPQKRPIVMVEQPHPHRERPFGMAEHPQPPPPYNDERPHVVVEQPPPYSERLGEQFRERALGHRRQSGKNY